MPEDTVTIEVHSDGPAWIRSGDMVINAGEQAEVNAGTAELLSETYDTVTVIDTDESEDTEAVGDETDELTDEQITETIDDGVCPWCIEEFENVGSHASKAHPDEWDQYKGGE